jgi:hypothetical protein
MKEEFYSGMTCPVIVPKGYHLPRKLPSLSLRYEKSGFKGGIGPSFRGMVFYSLLEGLRQSVFNLMQSGCILKNEKGIPIFIRIFPKNVHLFIKSR